MTDIIYIKYDYFDRDSLQDFLYELESNFKDYPWGAGFSLENFRFDQSYFYCNLKSSIFENQHPTFHDTYRYIQGVLSGYLIKCGLEIR